MIYLIWLDQNTFKEIYTHRQTVKNTENQGNNYQYCNASMKLVKFYAFHVC